MLKNSYYASLSPEKRKEYNRKANHTKAAKKRRLIWVDANYYKWMYGISRETVEKMFVEQNGKCAICKQTFAKKHEICVDHNHDTKQIRQLLCKKCNWGIGLFKEDISILREALTYLEKWSTPL